MEAILETLHPHRHCRLLVGCLAPTTSFRHGLGDNGEPCGHTGVGKRHRISHRRRACVYALARTAAMTIPAQRRVWARACARGLTSCSSGRPSVAAELKR